MAGGECLSVWPDEEGIKPLPNYDAWRISPLPNLATQPWRENVDHLLGWAILAPSAHNKQGWQVTIDEANGSINVWPRVADLFPHPPSDAKGRQTYIGVGCFTENLDTALQGYGLERKSKFVQTVVTTQEGRKKIYGVEYDLSEIDKGVLTQPELFQLMKRRRAYRGRHDETYKLGNAVLQEINAALLPFQEIRLDVITDRLTKIALGSLQYTADRVVLLIPAFRYELAQHLVPNNTEQRRVMPGDTFGLSDAKKVQNALQSPGQFDGDFAAGFARTDMDSVTSASAVGIISVRKDEPNHWIQAGMAFQKVWLIAQKNNLGLGIIAAMVESEAQNILLKGRLGRIRERPVVIFRLGKALEKRPHSPRINLEELLSAN